MSERMRLGLGYFKTIPTLAINQLYIELCILNHPRLLSHPNMIRLLETDTLPGVQSMATSNLSLVFEYADRGTLESFLISEQLFPWTEKYSVVSDISAGILVLHEVDIVHNDLKCANILRCVDIRNSQLRAIAKIADFGFSAPLVSTKPRQEAGATRL